MKKQFRIAAFSLLFGSFSLAAPGLAQDPSPGPPPDGAGPGGGGRGGRRGGAMDPDRQLQMLTKRLKLTSDQQEKIKPILADRATQMGSIRNDSSLQPDDRREKMRTLMTDTNSKIEGVLTDKQKKSYQSMEQERRERMQNRQGGGGAAPPEPPPQ